MADKQTQPTEWAACSGHPVTKSMSAALVGCLDDQDPPLRD